MSDLCQAPTGRAGANQRGMRPARFRKSDIRQPPRSDADPLATMHCLYGLTWNFTLSLSVPVGAVTVTKPVVAPAGTVANINVFETSLNTTAVPLKLTPVAPVRSVARILICALSLPELLSASPKAGPQRPRSRYFVWFYFLASFHWGVSLNTTPHPKLAPQLPTKFPPWDAVP